MNTIKNESKNHSPLDDFEHIELKPQRPYTQAERKLTQGILVHAGRKSVRSVRRGRGKSKGQGGSLRLPPELDITPVIGHTFRFRNSAAVTSQNITVGNLIGICGALGTVTNATVASIASSVKLRKIDIWPSEDTSTQHNPEISFSTNYGTTSDRSKSKSIPLGISVTGAMSARPKRDTLAALWQNSSTTSSTLGVIYDLPAGSVVDVHVSFTLRNTQAGVSYTVATAVLGTMYYLYLDGSTTHIFLPIALPSTF